MLIVEKPGSRWVIIICRLILLSILTTIFHRFFGWQRLVTNRFSICPYHVHLHPWFWYATILYDAPWLFIFKFSHLITTRLLSSSPQPQQSIACTSCSHWRLNYGLLRLIFIHCYWLTITLDVLPLERNGLSSHQIRPYWICGLDGVSCMIGLFCVHDVQIFQRMVRLNMTNILSFVCF